MWLATGCFAPSANLLKELMTFLESNSYNNAIVKNCIQRLGKILKLVCLYFDLVKKSIYTFHNVPYTICTFHNVPYTIYTLHHMYPTTSIPYIMYPTPSIPYIMYHTLIEMVAGNIHHIPLKCKLL